MSDIAYLIPGFGQSKQGRPWKKVVRMFEEAGIEAKCIDIEWKQSWPGDFRRYISAFKKQYKENKKGRTIVLGFSFGALIAYLTTAFTKPDALILCSLSPYFEDDLERLPIAWQRWWKKHYPKNTFNFEEHISSAPRKTYIVVGSKEHETCIYRNTVASKKIRSAVLHLAKGAGHKIGEDSYQRTLHRIVRELAKNAL